MTHHTDKATQAWKQPSRWRRRGRSTIWIPRQGRNSGLEEVLPTSGCRRGSACPEGSGDLRCHQGNKGWPEKETIFKHATTLKSVLDEAFEDMDAEPVKRQRLNWMPSRRPWPWRTRATLSTRPASKKRLLPTRSPSTRLLRVRRGSTTWHSSIPTSICPTRRLVQARRSAGPGCG